MTACLLELLHASITTPEGRALFEGLSLRMGRERVALIGRNGVGKSTLLRVLAGELDPSRGEVRARADRTHVPQALDLRGAPSASDGERRRRALDEARRSGAPILLLDEPSEDLDEPSVAWLRAWLASFEGCALVATHDRRLLRDFSDFFVVSEAGCRHLSGSLDEIEAELERARLGAEASHARTLRRLVEREEHTIRVARRKARKKRYGRCSELDRNTPRVRLNQKREQAQNSHGRLAKIREARIEAARAVARATRRAIDPRLGLRLTTPTLSADVTPAASLRGVVAKARVTGRPLFGPIDLDLARTRVAVVGPNGAGKTTLLDIVLGHNAPEAGTATRDRSRIGAITQGGANFSTDETLLELLARSGGASSLEEAGDVLAAHGLPIALGTRPLCTLSPGERTRAALVSLFRRVPAPSLLVLDEPTYSLDLLGQRALRAALGAWPGGLLVATHDRELVREVGFDQVLELGG